MTHRLFRWPAILLALSLSIPAAPSVAGAADWNPLTLAALQPEADPPTPANNDPATVQPDAVVLDGTRGAQPSLSENSDPDSPVPPAWAAGPIEAPSASRLPPFGANLFVGNFTNTRVDGLSPSYEITIGDQIALRVWGNQQQNGVLTVDHQGNVFIPDVGPIPVAGLRHRELQPAISKVFHQQYPTGVNVYTTLLSPQPLSVFVTGFVGRPGQYAGGAADSLLAFLDRAGGIVNERGSYRAVRVLRGQKEIARCDLYDFILNGILPDVRLEENDVVVVDERGPSIAVMGLLRQKARYEFPPNPVRAPDTPSFAGPVLGADLMRVAVPMGNVTHVGVTGSRDGKPLSAYISRSEFAGFSLRDNDVVEFISDQPSDGIMVRVSGAVVGDARFPLKKGATLCQLMAHVAVDPNTADLDSVYLRRRSVAEQQRRAIEDSLQRLQRLAYTTTSGSPAEAQIRSTEARMIEDFVQRVRQLKTDGVVVLMHRGQMADPMLEDGDIVVVPAKSQVVQMSGEVMMTKTIAHRNGFSLKQYIDAAGGFTRNADQKNVLIVRPNGEVLQAKNSFIGPGDHIIVLPRHHGKNMLLFKDLTQIIYQVAVATKVALDL